jgi:hypothetical protein
MPAAAPSGSSTKVNSPSSLLQLSPAGFVHPGLPGDGHEMRRKQRLGHWATMSSIKTSGPSLLGRIGVAGPRCLDSGHIPAAVRLAPNTARLLRSAHRRLAHAEVPGKLAITPGLHGLPLVHQSLNLERRSLFCLMIAAEEAFMGSAKNTERSRR